ncbi:MAG: hypothetical protein A2033_09980 [Bacteroidetes bacterium GWA2_31_9]|nr:MAG: hypothetical protein A2033_09980 [Bacteroidetes bacterium GWA2_31_9]
MTELVESKAWKKFMAKLYGWGASVVIIGALFKIMHWPGAGPMLVVGLSVEALIFFFSAFEPLHEEIDWSLAYPELAGMHEEELTEIVPEKKEQKKSALERFEDLLGSADLKPETFEKLGKGFQSLSDTTSKMSDISGASIATQEYVSNIKTASSSFSHFNESYSKSTSELSQNANELSNSYSKAAELVAKSGSNVADIFNNVGNTVAEKVANSGNELASKIHEAGNKITNTYQTLAESLQSGSSSVIDNNKTYAEQLGFITKNLSALNAVYELQLQGTNEQLKVSEQLYGGVNEMMQNLKDSVEDTKKYRDEVSKLGQNLASLNTIYGNMLSAMNFPRGNA